jgi:kelch-like protein 23
MNDTIYVTGGHYGSRGSSTYEKIQAYRPDINEWSIVTISPHPGMTDFEGSGHFI